MGKDAVLNEFDIDNDDVDSTPTDSDKGGSGKKGGDPASSEGGEDIETLRAELERERKLRKETEASERYWATQAQGRDGAGKRKSTAPPEDDFEDEEEPEADDEEEPELGEGFIDEFTANPKAAMKKAGLVTAKEARKLAKEAAEKAAAKAVGKATKAFNSDVQFITQYPELGQQDSELFKRTEALMKSDPELKGMKDKALALRMAAKLAKTELKAQQSKRPVPRDEEDEADPETERIRRIRAQDGDRGRRRSSDEPEVTGQQAAILRQMGVSIKGFQESRKRMGYR